MPMPDHAGVLRQPEELRGDQAGARSAVFPRLLALRAFDIKAYRGFDYLTEALIYFMVVFSPWAFGTSEEWSMWVMNVSGYCLGLLLAGKLAIRWLKGYEPGRWGTEGASRGFKIFSAASLRFALA